MSVHGYKLLSAEHSDFPGLTHPFYRFLPEKYFEKNVLSLRKYYLLFKFVPWCRFFKEITNNYTLRNSKNVENLDIGKKILTITTITAPTTIKTNLSFDFPNSHGYCICNHVNTFHCYGDYIVYLFIVQPRLQFTFSKKNIKLKRLKNAKLMFKYFHLFSVIPFPKK